METVKDVKTAFLKIIGHLKRNIVAYVMALVALAAIALQQRNRIHFEAFMVDHGIDPIEFYYPDDHQELLNN